MTNEDDKVRIRLVRQPSAAEREAHQQQKTLKLLIIIGIVGALFTGCAFGYFISNTSTGDEMTTLKAVYKIMTNNFVFAKNSDEYKSKLLTDAINGMVDSQGDVFTEYLTKDELASFNNSLDSSFVGIGVNYLQTNDGMWVKSVILNSPAEQAGIKAGDIIIGVDDMFFPEYGQDDLAAAIKGEKGTTVKLTIKRLAEQEEPLTITVTRGVISNSVYSEVKDGYGIMTISSFSTGTGQEVGAHLQRLSLAGVTKLIIDLRGDGGGYLSALKTVSSYFLDEGTVFIRQVDVNGKETVGLVAGGSKYKFDKIVMVIDKNTASSSEVFVLALKEHLNVKLVGQTTYGKGKAQTTKVFSDGSALKYTDFLWYSDNKVSVADVGIAPDTEVLLDDALYLSYLQLSDGVELAYDSVNTLTGQAQIMLNFLNDHVNDLREDGYFDRQTEKALMKFQSDNGISPASGKLDQKTAAALNAQVVMKWNEHQDKYDTQMMEAEKEILR